MQETPAISVVVCAYRARDKIDIALGSLRAQELSEPYEVVVSASGDDGTADYVRDRYPEVRVVSSAERLYPGPARNRGVAAATGRYVAFLPADGRARPDWLCRRLAKHRRGFEAVGGSIVNGTPRHPVGTAGYLLEYAPLLPSERILAQHAIPHCLSYERALIERLGGFPEDVETGEDTLFNARCVEEGVAIGFEPRAQLAHENLRGVLPYLRHQYEHGRGLMICVERHGLDSPTGPADQGLGAALWRVFASYPYRRWRYDLECLARGRPRWLASYAALTPLILAGLWATSLGTWVQWRGARS